ncbi:nuclear transport factor 2 family protein [Lysobacter tyrosinilyticus]
MTPFLRSTCLSIALLCGASFFAVSAHTRPSAEQNLLDLGKQLIEAQRTFDQAALESMLAPGYLEISPVGDVDTRTQVIGFYSPEAKAGMAASGKAPPMIELSEPVVRILGDDATVIARETLIVPGNDPTRTVAMRVLLHFHRTNGRWLLQTSQYTSLRKAATPK